MLAGRCPYFPFEDADFRQAVGARPLRPGEGIIEVDSAYRADLALKEALLAEDREYCFQALPGTGPAQWEALQLVLGDLARSRPDAVSLSEGPGDWRWENRLLGTGATFRPGYDATLPLPPLEWVGRQVQEDLLLVDARDESLPLVAGLLCFPSGWSLGEKIGRSLASIHEPVPGFAPVARPGALLLQRLRAGRPVVRYNWTFKATGELDLSPRRHWPAGEDVTPRDAGERLWLRVERQTLARLPKSDAVLFTVRTCLTRVGEAAGDGQRAARMLRALRTAPPELLEYKGMGGFTGALIAYLAERAA